MNLPRRGTAHIDREALRVEPAAAVVDADGDTLLRIQEEVPLRREGRDEDVRPAGAADIIGSRARIEVHGLIEESGGMQISAIVQREVEDIILTQSTKLSVPDNISGARQLHQNEVE